MTKVNLEVIKPWITQRVTEILGFEDDVVIEFIFNQLEDKVMSLCLFGVFVLFFRSVKHMRTLLSKKGYIQIIPSQIKIEWVK